MGEKTQLPRQLTPGTCSPALRPGKAERRPGASGEGEGAGQWRRCWGESWNVKWGVGAVQTELGDRRGCSGDHRVRYALHLDASGVLHRGGDGFRFALEKAPPDSSMRAEEL